MHRSASDFLDAHTDKAGDTDISVCFLIAFLYALAYSFYFRNHLLGFLITTG